MPVQRTYRRDDEHPIAAHHVDCGMYLFLVMLCLHADKSVGMLSPAIVHGARPLLAWSLVLRSNPIVISHWVRLNIVRGPVTLDVMPEFISASLSNDTRYKMRPRRIRAIEFSTEAALIQSRKPVKIDKNDPLRYTPMLPTPHSQMPAEDYSPGIYSNQTASLTTGSIFFEESHIKCFKKTVKGVQILANTWERRILRLLIFNATCWTQTRKAESVHSVFSGGYQGWLGPHETRVYQDGSL